MPTTIDPFRTVVSRRHFLGGLSLTALALGAGSPLLAACGGGSAKAPAVTASQAKQASGIVKVLVWQGYDDKSAYAGLKNVQPQAAYLATNEDTITKTSANGSFDALTIFQGEIDSLLKTRRIVPIDTALLPNYPSVFPFFRNSNAFKRNGKVYAVPYVWGTMMIAYSAKRMDAPMSFDDLMKPQLKGKIAMPDDPYACITTFARYAGLTEVNRLTSKQLDQVMALLGRFKPQLLTIANNYGELPAMYQRGEIWASVPDWTPTALAASDAQVRTTIPQEGAFSFVDSWMAVHDGANPAGAYALINQGISVDAQLALSKSVGLGLVSKDAAAQLDPGLRQAWHYDDLEANFAKAPLYAGVPVDKDRDIATYQEWIQRWQQFKTA